MVPLCRSGGDTPAAVDCSENHTGPECTKKRTPPNPVHERLCIPLLPTQFKKALRTRSTAGQTVPPGFTDQRTSIDQDGRSEYPYHFSHLQPQDSRGNHRHVRKNPLPE